MNNSKTITGWVVYVTSLDAGRVGLAPNAFIVGRCQGELHLQRSDLARWAVFPMRILVGYGFIEHGFAKLSRGPDAFAGILQQLGVTLPQVATWLTIGAELLGGLALLLGAFVVW